MGSNGETLAKQLEAQNEGFITLVSGLSDGQWSKLCSSEGWPVGVTAHHAAGSYGPISGMVQAIATRGPLPPITPQLLDQINAAHAQEFAAVSREQTVDLLRQSASQATSVLRGLSDDQLQQQADLFGNTVSAEQVAQTFLLGHAREHFASIQAALATN